MAVITKLEDSPFQKRALSLTHGGGAARQDAQGILGWGYFSPLFHSQPFSILPLAVPSLSVLVTPSKGIPFHHGNLSCGCCGILGVGDPPWEGVTSAGTDYFPPPDNKQTL